MSQSLLFRTMQAVVMRCVCQSWIKKLLTYLLTTERQTNRLLRQLKLVLFWA